MVKVKRQKLATGVTNRVLNKHVNSLKKGFTLLELLVVLVIMGVVIGAVALSIHNSGSGQKVRSATNILHARLLFAEQQAITQATTIGFAVSQQGYQFYSLHNKPPQEVFFWQAITHEQALVFQAWSGNFDISLSLPQNPNALVPNKLPEMPVIVFNPSGGVTPFTIRLDNFAIKAKQNGAVTIGTANA